VSAQLLEGKPVATQILDNVRARVEAMRSSDIQPGLATILVGDDPASIGYVRKKHEACAAVGMRSEDIRLGADTTQEEPRDPQILQK
jgi:methylenetetrahydrofolate dehydrogenase (NADP+)/methenyltetrahydrofolate cyclohydrolase